MQLEGIAKNEMFMGRCA